VQTHRHSNGGGPASEPQIAVSSGDFITDFVAFTEDDWSPELFRRWTAISMVAAALERRVWVKTGPRVTFPNLYTFLIGRPGAGKGVIDRAKTIMRSVLMPGTKDPAFWMSPVDMTAAGMVDALVEC
jgi:hypothetical protein